jgi:hypothetical protein
MLGRPISPDIVPARPQTFRGVSAEQGGKGVLPMRPCTTCAYFEIQGVHLSEPFTCTHPDPVFGGALSRASIMRRCHGFVFGDFGDDY